MLQGAGDSAGGSCRCSPGGHGDPENAGEQSPAQPYNVVFQQQKAPHCHSEPIKYDGEHTLPGESVHQCGQWLFDSGAPEDGGQWCLQHLHNKTWRFYSNRRDAAPSSRWVFAGIIKCWQKRTVWFVAWCFHGEGPSAERPDSLRLHCGLAGRKHRSGKKTQYFSVSDVSLCLIWEPAVAVPAPRDREKYVVESFQFSFSWKGKWDDHMDALKQSACFFVFLLFWMCLVSRCINIRAFSGTSKFTDMQISCYLPVLSGVEGCFLWKREVASGATLYMYILAIFQLRPEVNCTFPTVIFTDFDRSFWTGRVAPYWPLLSS